MRCLRWRGSPSVDALDINILRELAQLLDRTNRSEALEALLGAAGVRGVERDMLGYPAAAAALRQGKAGEARRLLLAQAPETDPIRWHWLMGRIADRARRQRCGLRRSRRDAPVGA